MRFCSFLWTRVGVVLAVPVVGLILFPLDLPAAGPSAQATLRIQITVVQAVPGATPSQTTAAVVNSVTIPASTTDLRVERRELAPKAVPAGTKKQNENLQGVLETLTVVAP